MDTGRQLHHGGWYAEDDDPQFWHLALGVTAGLILVTLFEFYQRGGATTVARFVSLTGKEESSAVDPAVRRRLATWVNGAANVVDFWSGGFLVCQDKATPEQYVKVFETLGLLSALLLTVGVTYFTASDQDFHLHGVVCCVANCSLLLGTLMSTFFAVALGTFQSSQQVDLFVGMIGRIILRGPILFFVVGLILLYGEMVLWFKMTIDAGSTCVICLTMCLILAPIFLHSMHKIGWAVKIVKEETAAEQRLAAAPTPEGLRARLEAYVDSKGGACLLMDRDEFLEGLDTAGIRATSVQKTLAGRLFDAHVEEALGQIGGPSHDRTGSPQVSGWGAPRSAAGSPQVSCCPDHAAGGRLYSTII
jgi:hypothetical protein